MKMKGDEEEKKDSSSVDGTSMAKSETSPNGTSHVYVQSDDHGWIPARFLRMNDEFDDEEEAVVVVDRYDDEQTMLTCISGKDNDGNEEADIFAVNLRGYPGGVLPLQNVDEHGDLVDYQDMNDLPFLHEAGILFNLKLRHMMGKPYTRTGDIVIAVNPYQWFHELYEQETQAYYAHKLLWSAEQVHKHAPKDLPPHVYETSTLAYKGMALGGQPQSILVSGESGSGKTETCKILQHHIAKLQQGPFASPTELDTSQVVKRVLDSNSLLEAFGNAQTRRNDNSSRFGKYTQLQFAHQSIHQVMSKQATTPARLIGSTVEVYLLEKSRVVSPSTNERNFHIFYELLAAPAQEQSGIWQGLVGKTPESFSYLGSTPTTCIEGASDHDRFFKTVKTLESVGIAGSVLKDLLRSLVIVLQLGNLVFVSDPTDEDKAVIASDQELQQLTALMGLSGGAEALRRALTERTMKTNKEVYKVPLTAAVAKDSCDALAKDIYEKVFLWLVWMINLATCAEHNYESNSDSDSDSGQKNSGEPYGLIGLLDIFGFEAYQVNGFEQLCINYANEKLQYRFTEDCFRLVQEEYKQEGISVEQISYEDNSDVLNLIEGKTGLLAMLNEECWRPRGSSAAFVNKALHQNRDSPCLSVNTMDRLSFGIHHFAGPVLYDAENFVRLNQDRLASDLKECATKSSNSIIAGEYAIALEDAETEEPAFFRTRLANSNVVAKTVWTKYKSQLSKLMTSLKSTEARFVRCIKPNATKSPLVLEHTSTINQLQSCGVVSSVTISRSAFPNRMLHSHVLSRFGGIRHPATESVEEQWKADVEALLSPALKSQRFTDPSSGASIPAFVVGKTKTFFRAGAMEYLEAERMSGLDWQAAIAIQRCFRTFLKHKGAVFAARFHSLRKKETQGMARKVASKKQSQEERKKQLAAKRTEELGKMVTAQRQGDAKMGKTKKSLKTTKEIGKAMTAQRQELDVKKDMKDKCSPKAQARQAETGAGKQEGAWTVERASTVLREEQEYGARVDKEEEVNALSSPTDDKPFKDKVEVTAKTKKRQDHERKAPKDEGAKAPVSPVADEITECKAEVSAKTKARQEQEWTALKEKEAKTPASPVDDELAKYKAEIAKLKQLKNLSDREADGKVKAANDRLEQAKKERRKVKRALDDHTNNASQEERSAEREIAHSKEVLGGREKLIEHLELEQKRLGKVFARTQKKRSAISEDNKKLKKNYKETSAVFKTSKQQSISLVQGIDDLQVRYKKVKEENAKLHALTADQQERFCLMAQAKLELQNTMAKILEIVQSECNDRELRAQIVRLNLKTCREAYKQMKVVQQLQKEEKEVEPDFPDFHESWVVHDY